MSDERPEIARIREILAEAELEAHAQLADYIGGLGAETLSADVFKVMAASWAAGCALMMPSPDLSDTEKSARCAAVMGLVCDKAASILDSLKKGS